MNKILLVVVVFLAFVPRETSAFHKKYFTPQPVVSYDELDKLAREIDAYYKELPSEDFTHITTKQDVYDWINEIVPFFAYEGINDPEAKPDHWGAVKYPREVTFDYYDTAERHIHVLGTTDCLADSINFNGRFLNDKTPLYDDEAFLAVIVHELAHLQGVCWGDTRLDDEVSAQLVTLEVMAAMVNRGNRQVLGPFLSEYRYMLVTAAKASAMENGREDDYMKLVHDILDPFEHARVHKSDRYWVTDPKQQQYILNAYNLVPINEILQNKDHSCVYYDIDVDKIKSDNYDWTKPMPYKFFEDERPCIQGVMLPINMNVFNKPLFIDDVKYLLDHLDEVTA